MIDILQFSLAGENDFSFNLRNVSILTTSRVSLEKNSYQMKQ